MPTLFACNHCGACCKNHRVPLTNADLRRLEDGGVLDDALEWLPAQEVDMDGEPETFVRVREGRLLLVLAHRQTDDGSACVFWRESRCSVYESRPACCRSYPFETDAADPMDARKREDARVHLTLHPEVQCDRTTGIPAPTGGLSRSRSDAWAKIPENEVRKLLGVVAERHRELVQYVTDVATWNRLQRRRGYAGRRPLTAEKFLAYLRARRPGVPSPRE